MTTSRQTRESEVYESHESRAFSPVVNPVVVWRSEHANDILVILTNCQDVEFSRMWISPPKPTPVGLNALGLGTPKPLSTQ